MSNGAPASRPGSREPSQQAVSAASGFDPSRCQHCGRGETLEERARRIMGNPWEGVTISAEAPLRAVKLGDELPEHLRWRGEGPPPAHWYAPCGTKVYRSYSDYCDD